MSDHSDAGLRRARRELDAAWTLDREGFAEQAVSRAYFACFFAAETALLSLGETRSKHSGVIAAFTRLVIKDGGLDAEHGATLRSLFESRNEVDYRLREPPAGSAASAIARAADFVAAVEDWVATR